MVLVVEREALGQELDGICQHLARQRDLAVALLLLGDVGNAGKHHAPALEFDDPQIAVGPELAAVRVLEQRLAILDDAVAHQFPADLPGIARGRRNGPRASGLRRLPVPAEQPFGRVALVDDFTRAGVVHPDRQRMVLDQEAEQVLALLALGDVEHADDQRGSPAIDAAPAVGRTPDRRSVGAPELDFVVAHDFVLAGERSDFLEFAAGRRNESVMYCGSCGRHLRPSRFDASRLS